MLVASLPRITSTYLLNAFIFDLAACSSATCEPLVHASSLETCYWLILPVLNVMMKEIYTYEFLHRSEGNLSSG